MIQVSLRLPLEDFVLEFNGVWPSNGVTALFGPSGSGKTTILRWLAGLSRPADATLQVNSEVWQSRGVFLEPHQRGVGYITQTPSFFSHLSVRDNILYGVKRAPSLAHSFDEVAEWFDVSPLLKRATSALSGGERQRVALARAVMMTPRIFLLDEPLAALDQASKEKILVYIERLKTEMNVPMIYVSHSENEIRRLADFVAILERGRIARSGHLHEIFRATEACSYCGRSSSELAPPMIE